MNHCDMRSHATCMLLCSLAHFCPKGIYISQMVLCNWDRGGGGPHRGILFNVTVTSYQIQHVWTSWNSTKPHHRTIQSCMWQNSQYRWIKCKAFNVINLAFHNVQPCRFILWLLGKTAASNYCLLLRSWWRMEEPPGSQRLNCHIKHDFYEESHWTMDYF